MKLKIIASIFLTFLLVDFTFAQNTRIDSLDNLIITSVTDTGRINLTLRKLDILSTINLDSAINLALKTLKDAQKIKFYKGEVSLRQRLVYDYSYTGNFKAAAEELNYLEQFIKPTKDSSYFANVFGSWGLLYGMQSKYDSSIIFYEKEIAIFERNGKRGQLGRSYSNIAIGYQQKSNFPMALVYQQKSLDLYQEEKNEVGLAYTYVNLANTYLNIGDMARAENAFLKSIDLAKKNQLNNVELYAYTNISSLYIDEASWQKSFDFAIKAANLGEKMGDQGIQAASLAKASRALVNLGQSKKALETSRTAIVIADSSAQPFNISQANASMGFVLKSTKKWREAIPYYERAFESIKDADIYTPNMSLLYNELSACYEKTGSYSKALDLYKQYSVITDSIRSRENIQKATEQTMNNEFEKKEQTTKAQQAAKDEITRTRQMSMVIGLVLSFIIIVGALYAYYSKQKANTVLHEQKDQIENTLTQLKSTQTQLIHSEKMASLGELTAGIAHEIQNPLNFVNNFSEVSGELVGEMAEEIEEGNMEDVKEIATDLKQNLEKINHHGQRASGIVKSMLEHSRTSDGTKELTDINKLADEYLRLSYHGLRAKDKSFNADFTTDFDPNLPKVNVVTQDISRVLLNLINNAFQALSSESLPDRQAGLAKGDSKYKPLVTVSTRKLKDEIEIRVKDNGSGIPDDIKDKIFEPFFTTKPTGEGTGLGLSMSYDIVTKGHGGSIEVKSSPEEGTEFTILLTAK
jgi:two-component system, NtrC family, sensor kinase